MEALDRYATISDPLLTCCLCRNLLQETVQMTCLHCCCRQCFSAVASKDSSQSVTCASCDTVTQAGREQPNGFVDSQVSRYKAIADSRLCGLCKVNDEKDTPALVWCSACRHSLCADCLTVHKQYFRKHWTQSLEDLGSLDEVCLLTSTAGCAIHKKPLDIACVNCEKVMCICCCVECKKSNHVMHIVGDEAFNNYVGEIIASISAMKSGLLLKLNVLDKPASILRDTKTSRDRHLNELNDRKRRIVDAVEKFYQKMVFSTKNTYDEIEADGKAEVADAARIGSALSDAQSYVSLLVKSSDKCEIFNQRKIVQERLTTLSSELDSLSDRLSRAVTEVKFDSSLPENLEDVVRAWFGMPVTCPAPSHHLFTQTQLQQQQQHNVSFGTASVSMHMPFTCCDVALTKDGRSLLLAAEQHGMLELSSSCGRKLSLWHPLKLSSSNCSSMDEKVQAVCSLSDGRAAVSLHCARLIVLLKREERDFSSSSSSSSSITAALGDAWTEQLCFDALPRPADQLSAQGDVLLAACQLDHWYYPGTDYPGTELQLLSLNSGRRLSNAVLRREYLIGSMSAADGVIVTGSWNKVDLGGSRRAAQVLDAHRFAESGSDERLWRHVLNGSDKQEEEEEEEEMEELGGVCADSSGGCLYAAVRSRNSNMNSRVCVLSLRDGSELRRVALNFTHSAAAAAVAAASRPCRLSLSYSGAAAAAEQERQSSSSSVGRNVQLAALDWNGRAVTVHHGCRNTVAQMRQHM